MSDSCHAITDSQGNVVAMTRDPMQYPADTSGDEKNTADLSSDQDTVPKELLGLLTKEEIDEMPACLHTMYVHPETAAIGYRRNYLSSLGVYLMKKGWSAGRMKQALLFCNQVLPNPLPLRELVPMSDDVSRRDCTYSCYALRLQAGGDCSSCSAAHGSKACVPEDAITSEITPGTACTDIWQNVHIPDSIDVFGIPFRVIRVDTGWDENIQIDYTGEDTTIRIAAKVPVHVACKFLIEAWLALCFKSCEVAQKEALIASLACGLMERHFTPWDGMTCGEVPTKIGINGVQYTVCMVPNSEKGDSLGSASASTGTIRLLDGMPKEQKEATLVHEWLHSFWDTLRIPNTEQQVAFTATLLYDYGFRVTQ